MGLLEYYEAVFDEKYLALAISLCRDQFEHFWDEEFAGFYFTADDGETLYNEAERNLRRSASVWKLCFHA